MSEAEILKFRRKHNQSAMVETLMGVRDMKRDPLPDNPPPDDKWKAMIGLARLKLNGACHRVMVCLIDHANPETGLCFPAEEFVAGWTGNQTRVIERAIATLRKKRLLHVVAVPCRTGRRNRYYINWTPLFAAFKEIKAFEKAHREKRDHPTKVSGSPPNDLTKVSGYDPTKVSAEPLKGEPLKNHNHQHEVVHSPKSERTPHEDEEKNENQSQMEEKVEPTRGRTSDRLWLCLG